MSLPHNRRWMTERAFTEWTRKVLPDLRPECYPPEMTEAGIDEFARVASAWLRDRVMAATVYAVCARMLGASMDEFPTHTGITAEAWARMLDTGVRVMNRLPPIETMRDSVCGWSAAQIASLPLSGGSDFASLLPPPVSDTDQSGGGQ